MQRRVDVTPRSAIPGEAAQAADDFFISIFVDLVRQLRIGEEGAGHFHYVRFSGCDDFFHHFRIVKTSQSGHRFVHMFFDLGRQIDVASVIFEPGRMCDAERLLVSTGGNVDQIDIFFYSLGDFDSFIQVVAAFYKFVSAHAEFDRESRTDCFSYGVQYFLSQTDAIFERTAVFVRSEIEQRREELIDQPAVSPVYHDHFEACAFCEGGCPAVSFYDLVDHFFCQLADFKAVGADARGRSPLRQPLFFVLIREISAGELTGVGEFYGRDTAVAAERICSVSETRKASRNGEIQMICVTSVRFRMNHAFRDGDSGCAAFCRSS